MAVSNFFQKFAEIFAAQGGCTTGVDDTSGKWKAIFNQKSLNTLFGHLWVVDHIDQFFSSSSL
jgi:hypothetical protein